MKHITILVVGGVAAVATLSARATTTLYTIQDVGTFPRYFDPTLSDTFAGTGFVGINTSAAGAGASFGHLLGLENYSGIFSETEIQVNISGLSSVTSAILSYNLLDGSSETQSVTATSYTANGLLGYNTAPPDNLGSITFASAGLSGNSVDVTSLLQNAVTAGQTWFGLYLTPSGPTAHQWTYTYSGYGHGADEATMRLTVMTVPEPTTLALTGLGMFSLILCHRQRK